MMSFQFKAILILEILSTYPSPRNLALCHRSTHQPLFFFLSLWRRGVMLPPPSMSPLVISFFPLARSLALDLHSLTFYVAAHQRPTFPSFLSLWHCVAVILLDSLSSSATLSTTTSQFN